MSDDLNIRAAKVLGCEVTGNGLTKFSPEMIELSGFTGDLWLWPMYLKFDSSYDWAMLGVKKCEEKGLLKKLYREIHYILDTGVMHLILSATPAQITQAWVEVLEKNNAQ